MNNQSKEWHKNICMGEAANRNKTVRMRTIKQSIEYFKSLDPQSCINEWWLRTMLKSGKFKHFHMAGSKYLINIDALEEFLSNPPDEEPVPTPTYGTLRKIGG